MDLSKVTELSVKTCSVNVVEERFKREEKFTNIDSAWSNQIPDLINELLITTKQKNKLKMVYGEMKERLQDNHYEAASVRS